MEDIKEIVEKTEWLLAQIDLIKQVLDHMNSRLASCGEGLRAKLEELRHPHKGLSKMKASQEKGTVAISQTTLTAVNGTESKKERRAVSRRKGNPISVHVANPKFEGWVIDRSAAGLSLMTDVKVAIGTRLTLAPTGQFTTPRSFTVLVRSCRAKGKNWILGCQFDQRLKWSDLRLFG